MKKGALFQFSPDGSRVAVATPDGRLTIWNSSGEVYQQYSPSAHLSAEITTMSWCPAAKLNNSKKKKDTPEKSQGSADIIALGTTAGTVVLYSVNHGDAVTTFEAAMSTVRINCVVWSNSCKSVIVGAQDGMVSIFSVMTLERLVRFNTGKEPVYSVSVTADDKHIISGSRKIKVWEVRQQKLVQSFIGHANEVKCLRCVEFKNQTYIISAAEEDRNLSVWKLDPDANAKKSGVAHMALSVNESVNDLGSVNVIEEEVITSVNTDQGHVLLFRFSLEKSKTKPLKPANSVQIICESEGKIGTNVPIQANILKKTDALALSLAYGSENKLIVEDLKVSELRSSHLLSRAMPTLTIGAEERKDYTKVVKPNVPDSVKYLVAGHPLPNNTESPKRGVKRAKESSDANVQSLEERLALLNSKSDLEKNVPKTDSLAQLLVQGLRSKDQNIILSVIDREDGQLINNTVKSLPVDYIVPLLSTLHRYLQAKGSGHYSYVVWTQSLISHHAGYLISAPGVQRDILLPLRDVVSARSANYQSVLKLHGKIEMIKTLMTKNRDGVDVNADKPPLLVYQDDSDNESDSGNYHLPPQADYDSDCLDEYLSNADNSSDEDDMEEEEVLEDIQENGTVYVNGHDSGSEMEED